MFIQIEETPNPATLKFLPGCDVLGQGTADFPDAEAAAPSPLAQALFGVDGVRAVFLGGDFVSVSKREDVEWFVLKPKVLGTILEHFTAGRPVMIAGAEDQASPPADEDYGADQEIVDTIRELLDMRVRPAVAQDGGDIIFHGFDQGTVFLQMRGACAGCPSSTATLKAGIENLLKHYVPEVTEVRAVDPVA